MNVGDNIKKLRKLLKEVTVEDKTTMDSFG